MEEFWVPRPFIFPPQGVVRLPTLQKKMIKYIKLMILVMNKIKGKLMKYLTRQRFQVIKEY